MPAEQPIGADGPQRRLFCQFPALLPVGRSSRGSVGYLSPNEVKYGSSLESWAISITGIAGVGAFVLYALYKDWLRLEAVSTLTRPQRFLCFKFFLILTFLFGLAALALGAYRLALGQTSYENLNG